MKGEKMDDENWKGKLQEWAVHEHWTPKYDTTRSGGRDHEPYFRTSLYCGTIMISATGRSKKRSEQEAARKACGKFERDWQVEDQLSSCENSENSFEDLEVYDKRNEFVVLVDYENVHKLSDAGRLRTVAKIHLFCSQHSHLARKDQNIPGFMELHLVESTRRDASDVAMIRFSANLEAFDAGTVQIFVSLDKIFSATAELLCKNGVLAHHTASLAGAFEFTETLLRDRERHYTPIPTSPDGKLDQDPLGTAVIEHLRTQNAVNPESALSARDIAQWLCGQRRARLINPQLYRLKASGVGGVTQTKQPNGTQPRWYLFGT